ncbi:hypothetical protein IMZ48_02130 [Candidatus Bathyarchaeota archaeon]|nr:hypothetical protein [Candidatus Bathyarchaeota archaeon]
MQGPGFPDFAMNNTYGYQAYSEEVYEMAMGNLTAPGTGCEDLIKKCRDVAKANDPDSLGNDAEANEDCTAATAVCFGVVQGAYTEVSDVSTSPYPHASGCELTTAQRSFFDISLPNLAVYPPEYRVAFFNQRWVQEHLGSPVNFTVTDPNIVSAFFEGTGDPMRRDISSLEHVLDSGVSLSLWYGDLDYRCNCEYHHPEDWNAFRGGMCLTGAMIGFGAEAISLQMEYPEAPAFRSAGYTPIQTNDTYTGGLARQHGNVSFSRIFGGGHSAAAYQPETVYRIFDRAMSGKDVGTGDVEVSEGYSSEGPETVFDVRHELPEPRETVCYLYDAPYTCTPNQIQALVDGTAVVVDFVVVEPAPVVQGEGGEEGEAGEGGSAD